MAVSDEEWRRDVLSVLRRICRVLEQQRRPSRMTRDDRARLAAMLPVIGGVFGPELFTAREVLKHDSPDLRLVRGPLNAKQIGRLLQRAEGEIVGGLTVQRDGSETGVILWRVLAAS
jgi:hypothetical protein